MDIFYASLHTSLLLVLIFAALINFCYARESVWSLKLTQASCECATPNYVYTGTGDTFFGSCYDLRPQEKRFFRRLRYLPTVDFVDKRESSQFVT